ncbi:hypothetical protein AWV79_34195 [Cupriavidus sp. UYMMa02A]|nr:hypothetical protein AWV79_34195 [Cupriavidus sp. UYMMa02A]
MEIGLDRMLGESLRNKFVMRQDMSHACHGVNQSRWRIASANAEIAIKGILPAMVRVEVPRADAKDMTRSLAGGAPDGVALQCKRYAHLGHAAIGGANNDAIAGGLVTLYEVVPGVLMHGMLLHCLRRGRIHAYSADEARLESADS